MTSIGGGLTSHSSGWECEFRNDSDSNVSIYYTVNYFSSFPSGDT